MPKRTLQLVLLTLFLISIGPLAMARTTTTRCTTGFLTLCRLDRKFAVSIRRFQRMPAATAGLHRLLSAEIIQLS